MRAVRFVGVGRSVEVTDCPKPTVQGPSDVVIRIAGSGVCRTDLHILEGVAPLQPAPPPPFTLGHENAGWVEDVGEAVTSVRPGDPVILHPGITCGLCAACRSGDDMYCPTLRFPGVDGSDGGYAEYLGTSERAVVPLTDGTDPVPLAPYADAGVTAYHAVKRVVTRLPVGSVVLVIGVGGLGHLGLQLLRAMTPARVLAVDAAPARLDFARRLGAEAAFLAGAPDLESEVQRSTAGRGVDVVMDFVGEGATPEMALGLLRRGGTYSIVGYGGSVASSTMSMIVREITIQGNFVGTYRDLVDLMELHRRGKIAISALRYPLEDAGRALDDVRSGRVLGRAVLVP